MPIKKKHKHVTDENRTRPVAVKFYLSDEEATRFDKLATETGLTRRELVMSSIDGIQIMDASTKEEIQKLYETVKDMQLQLKGIAVNINQMAKIANTHGDLPSEEKLRELANEAMTIGKEVGATCQSLNRSTHGLTAKQP